ncbi:hypothetical protein GC209_07080 [bacterium]|nr:hypothetical protein [bacterium]
MNMTLRSRRASAGLFLCCALLVGCGNAPEAGDSKAMLASYKVLAASLAHLGHKTAKPAPDAATLASLRQVLVSIGKPIYSVTLKKTNANALMTPYGQNGPVQTWASGTPQTVSLRDGILVATRGYGADIMTSEAPSLAQVRSASGEFHRIYYYLDGADQSSTLELDCSFAAGGTDTVTVVGQSYATHRVTEDCTSPSVTFQNVYWFDASGKIRQSDQYVSPELATMRLQRVID